MMELNKLNLLLSLVREQAMSKAISYVCSCDKSVIDDLITDYTAFGVKGAGTSYRVLYGTGEIDIALQNAKEADVQG